MSNSGNFNMIWRFHSTNFHLKFFYITSDKKKIGKILYNSVENCFVIHKRFIRQSLMINVNKRKKNNQLMIKIKFDSFQFKMNLFTC